MKPLLAAKFDLHNLDLELDRLYYPVVGTPKIDGIRILVHPTLGAVTRQIKRLRNDHVWSTLQRIHSLITCLDGEITVGPSYNLGPEGDVYNRTTCIMAKDGTPNFTYHVFDTFRDPNKPYSDRQSEVEGILASFDHPSWLRYLEPKVLTSANDILKYEYECLQNGYEGVMLRSIYGPYKFGRSTLKEQTLIKLKRTTDAEAKIIGVEPRYQNNNEQQRDELGYAKRSQHQENKVALPMVGKFIVRSRLFQQDFSVGSGFDHSQATKWWEDRVKLVGRTISFKYQEIGTIDRPRHPIFLRFRDD